MWTMNNTTTMMTEPTALQICAYVQGNDTSNGLPKTQAENYS